ncbi:MAG: phosphatase PAP2 family protein [Solirubrobacteraceae bacterium]|nr:phosphatase PAP2 family protein [Solirubrobacteraceae bacterium]
MRRRWSLIVTLVIGYAAYVGGRWIFAPDLATAHEHARGIIDLQDRMGLAVEPSAVGALDFVPKVILDALYLAVQLVVVPVGLWWVYRRSPRVFGPLRDTMLVTWFLAVAVYAAYPVAPPRMVPESGLAVDGGVPGGLMTSMYNELAAVPSMHVAYATALGIGVACAIGRRPLALLPLLWGPAVTLLVMGTANHYFMDAVLGLAAIAIGAVIAALLRAGVRVVQRRAAAAVLRPEGEPPPGGRTASWRSRLARETFIFTSIVVGPVRRPREARTAGARGLRA